MDGHGQHENGRYRVDYYRGAHPPWNMMPQHQVKEQNNALVMNKKIMSIIDERDAAIIERNIALAEKKEALAARDEALHQRDRALADRDCALMERDKALAVVQYQENNFSMGSGLQRGAKRMHNPTYHSTDVAGTLNTREMQVTNALPMTVITQAKQAKEDKSSSKKQKSPRNAKKMSKDLNQHTGGDVKKFRSDWDDQNMGLKLVNFDYSIMPVPVCSCTGVPRQCYKWGSGGWQSSCCTTTLSSYPLPQMPNKRHVRVGGRKMSGSVFTKLISRLSFEGHDLSVPVDLKNYWAKHGTNRYITIK